ncbi:MAG TPA: LURP-one-related family protein [Acidimicrobiales bacterium]|nr:LURP-one-related family protein [Acidimicrobiales bacterium]
MADGGYQRTCGRCQHTWFVPSDIAEERPNLRAAASQYLSTIGGKFDDQVALRTHYQQLAAAARCPQCGATSFTQQKVAESPTSPEPPSEVPPSAPSASTVPDGQVQTYVLNQKLISLTGDSWIEDGQGNHAFAVDGQLLSLRGTHVLKDLSGQPLYEISKPLAPHLHKTIDITHAGQTAATVQEAVFHLGGDKFKITLAGAQELTVKGDWQSREFQVTDQAGRQVMTVSRAWFSMHDGYGIQIAPGFEVPLGLAILVALERVEAQERGEQSPLQNLLGGIGPF